ncbi:hypothetical protein BU14_0135s0034 [Porphyra umbilicalis]|uniref:Uncharacterized protein n=1 Tax=Porphyra umbilicalis TaxID=2786 RepID=A0A1X6PAI3_PORUM|nr:hypothetical protein BU14_0135s0034 [Porphyra umbilicalis]|eukprot:OSX77760.1 hypothetical protein BU14_0135s0034 [Porphyra umbilicalis]
MPAIRRRRRSALTAVPIRHHHRPPAHPSVGFPNLRAQDAREVEEKAHAPSEAEAQAHAGALEVSAPPYP